MNNNKNEINKYRYRLSARIVVLNIGIGLEFPYRCIPRFYHYMATAHPQIILT